MRLRKIRTMRNVWDELAGRRCKGPRAFGALGAERVGLAGGIVRIQTPRASQIAGSTNPGGDPAVQRQGVHPWVFRRVAARPGRRVKGRVRAVLAPEAKIRKRQGGAEFVVLYSLPHVIKESIEVELRGDVLRLTAHGTNPDTGAPFEVFSEALLPEALSDPRVQYAYAGAVLEVLIAPVHGPSGRRDAGHEKADQAGSPG